MANALDPQLEIKAALRREFLAMQERNPALSLRGFARRLDLSPTAVSQIMNGDRHITRKMAGKFLETLKFSSTQKHKLRMAFGIGAGLPSVVSGEQSIRYLAEDEMAIAGNWIYFAVLVLAETEGFRSDSAWIARRLKISKVQALEAIERLTFFKFLKVDEKGQLVSTGRTVSAGFGSINNERRKHNQQNLQMAAEAMDKLPFGAWDMSHVTLSFDPSRMPEAIELIKKFRREFMQIMESGPRKEVFKLCIQLFPLSKEINGEKP